MQHAVLLLTFALVAAPAASAQRPDPQVELLERMTGHWVLRGTIAKQQTTHDVDVAWDFTSTGIGHARPASDRIPFVFKDPGGGGIRTTFIYDRKADQWRWTLDNEDKGKLTAFARATLTHK